MYLTRTSVRTAHVLKWRQNRHERCLSEFVYFTLFVHNFCIPHNFTPSKSHANSYVLLIPSLAVETRCKLTMASLHSNHLNFLFVTTAASSVFLSEVMLQILC